MPLTIGARPHAPDDPFVLLVDCHERIRRFSALALKLAKAPPETPPAELADAAAAMIRYFTIALPLHEQDEEASLAPRLGDRDIPDAARAALSALGPEHRALEETLAGLVPRWQAIADDPRSMGAPLLPLSQRLTALFDAHLHREERDLFPAAKTALTSTDLAALLREMRERRL